MKQEMPTRNRRAKKSQEETIREHMQKYGSITTMEAFERYGITRLAARISDLKTHGEKIERESIEVRNRYGEYTHVVKYSMEEAE